MAVDVFSAPPFVCLVFERATLFGIAPRMKQRVLAQNRETARKKPALAAGRGGGRGGRGGNWGREIKVGKKKWSEIK